MPSNARKAFDKNLQDIERLLRLHEQQGGNARGRRYGLEVLNKSAIVLITSYWEAYCEDLASEALVHIVKHVKSAKDLPTELKKQIARELEKDKHELAIWEIADEGWRKYLEDRLESLKEIRNRKLNTPKTENIDNLFKSAIGLSKVSSNWRWSKKMTITRAREKLDRYVSLRGEIAHRGQASKTVKKSEVEDYLNFIKRLAAKTGGNVNSYIKRLTKKPLWRTKRFS